EVRRRLTQRVLHVGPSPEWLHKVTKGDGPCAPVLTRFQVIKHPHAEAMEIVQEYDHPQAGRLRQSRAAARFLRTPTEIRRHAPALGADTDAVLAEIGYSAEEIAGLHAEGAISSG